MVLVEPGRVPMNRFLWHSIYIPDSGSKGPAAYSTRMGFYQVLHVSGIYLHGSLFFKLPGIQFIIVSLFIQQLQVGSALKDFLLLYNQYKVCLADCG